MGTASAKDSFPNNLWKLSFLCPGCAVSTVASEITVTMTSQSQSQGNSLSLDKILSTGYFESGDFLKFSVHTTPQMIKVLGKILSACSFHRQFLKQVAFQAVVTFSLDLFSHHCCLGPGGGTDHA